MAVFTIAGLTLREAVRRKTLVGAGLLGMLVLLLSCVLYFIRLRLNYNISIGRIPAWRAEGVIYPSAISVVTLLCLAAIKSLSSLFALLLAGGVISSEIERGLLSTILPKPIPRWQILLGKWIGIQVVLISSVLVWTVLAWASLSFQTHSDRTPMLKAGAIATLFPVIFGTLTLTFSTFAQRLFGTSLAIALSALAWADGILSLLSKFYDVDILQKIARVSGFLVPQGYVSWWVEEALGGILTEMGPFGRIGSSPRLLEQTTHSLPQIERAEGVYVAVYILATFLLGVVIFQKRDV